MTHKILKTLTILFILTILTGCAAKKNNIVIESEGVLPGSEVTRKGMALDLIGDGIEIGKQLPKTDLVDMRTMKPFDLSAQQGSVLFISVVPSIDTKVCEEQTHYLGEEGDSLPATIKRITVSRDLPFAQARFAEEAKLEDLHYLSDYKEAAFGRSTGLLVDGPLLLARSVILVDKQGNVQYIQVVPELTHLPDMDRAFQKAIELDSKP